MNIITGELGKSQKFIDLIKNIENTIFITIYIMKLEMLKKLKELWKMKF